MENYRHRQSEKLAETEAEVSGARISKLSRFEESNRTRRRRDLERHSARRSEIVDPTVEIRLCDGRERFSPGDFLSCEYDVKLPKNVDLAAIESSVIWKVDGKGDADMGVHFFERRLSSHLGVDAFSQPQRLSTVLPQSPLSYDGRIIKVGWQVRVRLFLNGGREFIADQPFLLSHDDAPRRLIVEPEANS